MDATMKSARWAKGVAIWAVCALLAAVFLIVGIQKLAGGATYWVQIFSMAGYPPWFRTVVGLAETVGGVCLLIPRFSSIAATALAIVMFGATFTQLVSGEGGASVPALLLILLLVVAWNRRPPELRAEESTEGGE
jgi:putative oxidoreductase